MKWLMHWEMTSWGCAFMINKRNVKDSQSKKKKKKMTGKRHDKKFKLHYTIISKNKTGLSMLSLNLLQSTSFQK